MNKIEKLIDDLTMQIFKETEDLNDTDYIEVLENIASNLEDAANAKREELDL